MKKTIILFGLVIGLVVLSGCSEISKITPELEQKPCGMCSSYYPRDDVYFKKICECYNKNNISYTVDFNCDENSGRCEGFSFEDKKKMAMIDDSWYCICDETIDKMFCEDIEPCVSNVYSKIINRTTEFIWSY